MSEGSVLAALRVILGADTSSLDKDLAGARGTFSAFGSSIASSMAIATAAVAGAAAAVGLAFQSAVDNMDNLSKMSARIGVPIEQLSALKYAANLSDVSIEDLGKSVGKLSKNMVEAAGKPTSEAANAFRALGVSVVDNNGKLKSADVVMGEVADKFEGLKDGAGKTAVSMAIFGKSGASIIPLLNDGSDGLREMTDEARRFGLVIDGETGKAAEDFNDNLTRLKSAWEGIVLQASAAILPTMVKISESLVEGAKSSGILETAVKGLTIAMQSWATASVIVGATLKVAAGNVAAIASALSLLKQGEFSAAWETLKQQVGEVTATAASSVETIKGLWGAAGEGAAKAAESTDKAGKAQKDFNYHALAGKNAVDQFIAGQAKSIEAQKAEISTFGMLAGAMEAEKLQLQALAIAKANNTTITAQQQMQLDLLKQKTSDYAMTLAGLQMTQANLEPAQLYQQELAKIQALFDAGKISADTYAQATESLAERASASWNTAGAQMAGGFADLAGAFASSSKEMAATAQAFGIIEATINTYTAFTKALASAPPPWNYALAAGVLAAGMAKVVAIKQQKIGGFKTGGSFTVGGSGGLDSQLVPIMATPGEQVDIWRPDERGGDPRRGAGGGSSPTVVNLTIGAASAREFLRGLIEDINGMTSDGYRLQVAGA